MDDPAPNSSPALTAEEMAQTHAAAFRHSRPWSAHEFADLLRSRHCFVVGNAQSFALVRVIVDEAELLTLATHPDHQRQGLGRKVMQRWQQKAEAQGAQEAFLEVASNNIAAQTLYQSCGFVTVGIREGYYEEKGQHPVDALLMRRSFKR